MSGLGRPLGKGLIPIIAVAYFSVLALLLLVMQLSPMIVLALTVGGILIIVISLEPYWGLQVFLMILFVEGAAGQNEGVTPVKVLGAAVIWSWLMSAAIRRRSPFRFDRQVLLTFAFLLWCGISLIYAIDAEAGLSTLFTFGQLVLASTMFSSVVDTPARLRGVFGAIVIWTFVATCVAIGGYYLGITKVASGLVGNRNLLATYIIVAIVCAYLQYQATSHRSTRTLLALALPVFFLGLCLTFSRTGLIIQAIVLVLVWYRVAKERHFLLIAGSTAILCVITLLLPAGFYQRVSTIVPAIEHRRDTFGMRVQLWELGLRMIEERPVVGVGPGNFAIVGPRYNHGAPHLNGLTAHNTYVGLAAEIGLVGLTLFVLIMLESLRRARLAIREAKKAGAKEVEMFAAAGEICLLMIAMGGMLGTVENLKLLWVVFGVCSGLPRLVPSVLDVPPPALQARTQAGMAWTLEPGGSR